MTEIHSFVVCRHVVVVVVVVVVVLNSGADVVELSVDRKREAASPQHDMGLLLAWLEKGASTSHRGAMSRQTSMNVHRRVRSR
jgi:hypothetical protein